MLMPWAQRIAFLMRVCELVFAAACEPLSGAVSEVFPAQAVVANGASVSAQVAASHEPFPTSGCAHVSPKAAIRTPISVHCPDGIIQKIAPAGGRYVKPVRVERGKACIACAGCIYPARQYVKY